MENRIQEFILTNLPELRIIKEGVMLKCAVKGRQFKVSPDGVVIIQGEVFTLPEGQNLYDTIHTEYRTRILDKFLNGEAEEPEYQW